MTTALGAGLPQAPAGAAEQEPLEALSRFSDLQPQDWAYQALMDLQQRYGCVAGVPGGAFAGQRSISRFEAAALLLACLDRVEALTDEVQRLLNDLQPELARLRARVDGLPGIACRSAIRSASPRRCFISVRRSASCRRARDAASITSAP
jgi:hypothetical protein